MFLGNIMSAIRQEITKGCQNVKGKGGGLLNIAQLQQSAKL